MIKCSPFNTRKRKELNFVEQKERKQYNTLSAVSLLIEQINLGNLVTGLEGKYVAPEGIENIELSRRVVINQGDDTGSRIDMGQ